MIKKAKSSAIKSLLYNFSLLPKNQFAFFSLLVSLHLLSVLPLSLISQSNPNPNHFLIIQDQHIESVLSLNHTFFDAGFPSSNQTAKDFTYMPLETSGEVLGYFPSIATSANIGFGHCGSLLFRGINSLRQTSQSTLLSDGYRINLASFAPLPLSIIPLIAIRQIETKPGNAASRYGDRSMSGLINLGDRRNDGYFTQANASYGSFNTSNISLIHGAGAGNAKYRLFAAAQSSDGFRENSASKSYNFGGNMQIPVSRNSVIFFNSINHILEAQLPGFIAGLQSADTSYSPPVFSHDRNQNEYYIANAGFRNRFNRNSLVDVKLGFQHININGNNTYAGLPPTLIGTTPGKYNVTGSFGNAFYGNTKNTQLKGNHYDLIISLKSESPEGLGMIEGGAEAGYGTYQKSVFDVFKGFEDDYAENYQPTDSLDWNGDGYIFNTGVFVHGELLLATPLKAQAGLRYDFSTDHFTGQKPDTVLNRQFSAVTPRIGLLLSTGFTENYTGNIYAGYYHAFAFPTPDERVNLIKFHYQGFVEAGPSLFPIALETPVASDANFKNQRSRTFEIGTFQKFELKNELFAEIELTGFLTEMDNRIVFDHQTSRFQQIEKSETTGLEISVKLNYKNLWGGFFNYAFADAKNLSGQFENKVIPGIPKNILSTAVIFNHPSGFFATLAMQRKGKIFVDNENEQELKGHFVFNTRAGFTFRFVTAYFDVMNLFDTEYYADGFSRNDVSYYYPAAGRHFTAGLKLNF